MADITREQFFDFVKSKNDNDGAISKETQHYLDYFDYHQRTGKKESWNCAALWGAFWFAHRQINWFWFPLFIIDCALCTQILSPYGIAMFVLLRFLFARYANYFYLRDICRKISKGQWSEKPHKNEIMWGDPFFLPELLPIDLLIFLYKAIREKNKKDILIACGIILALTITLIFKFYYRHY